MSSERGAPAATRASAYTGNRWLHFVQSVTFSTLPRVALGTVQSAKFLPSTVQHALTRSLGLFAVTFCARGALVLSVAIAVSHASIADTASVASRLYGDPTV